MTSRKNRPPITSDSNWAWGMLLLGGVLAWISARLLGSTWLLLLSVFCLVVLLAFSTTANWRGPEVSE